MYYHGALEYHDPETGLYDKTETINPEGGISVVVCKVVCPTCEGEGTHFRSDLDETSLYDSMVEDGDYDGIEAYRKGRFDQVCGECNGLRVVDEPQLPEWAQALVWAWEEDEEEARRYADMERRMGA